jgi:hypothetical protein
VNDAFIIYFPVGNGDMSLIQLSDRTTIIIDCNITQDSLDETDDTQLDIHSYLSKLVKRDDSMKAHIDSFILTHPDQDHCRGFEDLFYTGDPSDFNESAKRNGLIIIDELWFSPRIFSSFEDKLSDSANAFKEEAERRMDLYRDKDGNREKAGNRLRIVGYSDNDELKGLNEIITVPGNYIDKINNKKMMDFSFFIHAPFKADTDSKRVERNETCIVLQARFDIDREPNACLAMFGGDAGFETWETILKLSKDETLQWDIFLAPHHGSWKFFSEEHDAGICESSRIILNMKRKGAIVVASCKKIKRDDDNPPSYVAANLYKKEVGDEKFFVTSEYYDREKRPLIFELTRNGPAKGSSPSTDIAASSAAINRVIGTPKTYG